MHMRTRVHVYQHSPLIVMVEGEERDWKYEWAWKSKPGTQLPLRLGQIGGATIHRRKSGLAYPFLPGQGRREKRY